MPVKNKYHVEELSCNECAEIIIENLEKLNFISSININYDSKDLIIESENQLSDVEFKQVLSAILIDGHCHEHNFNHIQDIVTEEFDANGIDCIDCIKKVEDKLNSNESILDARVNLDTKKIIITHENNVQIYDVVSKVIGECDDHHHICHEDSESEEEKTPIIKFILFGLGVLFTILGFICGEVDLQYLSMGLFIAGYLLIGYDILIGSIKEAIEGDIFNENMLMVIASVGSLFLQEYLEATMVVFLFTIGEYFQDRAADNSKKAIRNLMDSNIQYVTLSDGTTKYINDVNVGEVVSVKVGEKIPLDGVLKNSDASVDMKALTGESIPKYLSQGEEILSGSINLTNVIEVEVTKKNSESTMSKVSKLVEEASKEKSHTEQFITKFAHYYTPVVLGIAIIVMLIQMFSGVIVKDALNNFFTVLVIACPCALVISIPLGYFSGIGASSRNGILVKGGNYLDDLSKVESFVFDKTGTITKGNFSVVSIKGGYDLTDDQILDYIASCEAYSLHPIAKALQQKDKHVISDVKEIAGAGIYAKEQGKEILVGNEKLMEQFGINYDKNDTIGTIVYLAYDNKFQGSIVIADEIKPSSYKLFNYLKSNGYNTYMLTGDSKETAEEVGSKIGVDIVKYKLLPEDKFNYLKEIIANTNGKVAFIGDGINDSPSLSLADIGIAMGGIGTDEAKECADIVIMNDDISKIKDAIKISKYTKKIILQNIIFILIIKVAAFIIGILGIAQSYGMIIAEFSDVGVCLLAILNTLRILRFKPQKKDEL